MNKIGYPTEKKCHPFAPLSAWLSPDMDNVAAGGRSQITNFVLQGVFEIKLSKLRLTEPYGCSGSLLLSLSWLSCRI